MESSTKDDQRVMTIVAAALKRSSREREAYLQQACGHDQALYAETLEAVRWEERMGTFLQRPMVDFRHFARPFQIGQVVSERFEIIREIGEGGMGIVYEAFDRKRKQRIAIKSAKPGFQRLLSPELEGALKVRHPNICLVNEIHTAQTEHGEVDFLTMELLEGESLSVKLSTQGKFSEKEALDTARQLCAGIAEAHRSGIIHRDLKSANVILCRPDGNLRVVITDFGLSGAMALEQGEVAGTPAYMAPELWRGGKASKASDIYALGVILYEVVTGSLPFDSKSRELSRTSLSSAPSARTRRLNPRWDRVILQCLAASPTARPADAEQVFARLEKKPLKRIPLVALIILAFASFSQTIREPLFDLFRRANVRFAVLPIEASPQVSVVGGGVVQDVSDRIGYLRSGHRTISVISPSDTLRNHVHTPEEARNILHATHALQIALRSEGDELITQGYVVDLSTNVHLREFAGRYSLANIGTIPGALTGEVSLALRLHGSTPEVLSPVATGPYDRALYILRNDSHRVEDATSLFGEAGRIDSRSPLPLAGLVEAEVLKFDITRDHRCLEEAQRFLQAAESVNPDSVRVRLAAGLLNERAGQYGKALEDYVRVQDLEPRNTDAFLRIAAIYNALEMPEKAIDAYQKAIALDPGFYEPYEELGEFYFYRGKYPEAAEQFRKTIQRAPGVVYAHTNLGAVLSDLGRYGEAEQALFASLKLQETARALNSLGATRVYQKRDADAITYFERAVALDPHDFVYVQNLADSNRRLRRFTEAKAGYRRAMDLILQELSENPRLGYQRAFLAYVVARLGDKKRAEDEISQAMQLSPSDNKVIRKAVLTYEALGERDRAIGSLRGATPEVLHELDRQPDLTEFRQDLRFQHLMNNLGNGGK